MSFLGGLIDSFTGKGARRDLDRGIAAVDAGKVAARGEYTAGETAAQGYNAPWLNRGGREMYDASLGLKGGAARDAAQDVYTGDPILNRLREADAKKAGWAFNARGGYGAGAHALADSEINTRHYGDWQNRLAGVAGQEYDASGRASGISQWGAAGRAGAEQGATGALAGLYQNRAQTQNALAQNIIGGIGAVGTFFGGKPAPQGTGQIYGSGGGGGDPMSGQADSSYGNNIARYFGGGR